MNLRPKSNDPEHQLRHARERVELLVKQGEENAASIVLGENSALANDEESVLEIIYAEFLALESCGVRPESSRWLDRFPAHRSRLERLLKLHDFLSTDQPVSTDGQSEVGSLSRHSHRDRVPEQDVAVQPFARYELLNEIGRGGMGIVYRARQQGLGRIVAVKVLRSIEIHSKVRFRFQKEAETVASLQHPNIVQVIEISLEAGKEFLSMEYLGGGSLEAKLRDKKWSNHEIAVLIQTLAEAVHYAHERGIIHRDLKPANVIFTTELTPKIVDFGLAKKIQDDLKATVTEAVLGTPCYMSPEQAAGNETPIGVSTDVYSLGVILYQMLTGRLPFEGKTAIETLRWILDRDCDPPSRYAQVPRDLETICLKCLSKSPGARYDTAQELADDLARFLDHSPIRARRASWLERMNRRIRRHPQVAILAASIIVVSIGASTVLFYQNRTVDQLSRENAQRVKSEAKLREQVTRVEGAYEASLEKARSSVKEWTQLGLRLDSEPGMDGLRRKAFEDAIAHYDQFLSAGEVEDTIRFEAAVAAIRAAHFHADLGEYGIAESELRKAEKWLEPVPVDLKLKWNQADIQISLANILRRVDRWEESYQAYHNAIKIVGELLEVDPNNTGYLIRQSNALVNFCVVLKYQGKLDQGLNTYVQALRLSTKAAAIRAKQTLPDFLSRDAIVGKHEIHSALDQVIGYLAKLCCSLQEQDPTLLVALAKENYLPEIALCLDDAGQILESQLQMVQAELSIREAIRLRKLSRSLAQENRRIDQFLARSETNLGKLLFACERFEEARGNLDEADQIYSKLVEDFPERTDCRTEWAHCLMSIARCNRAKLDWQQAAKYSGMAVEQLKVVAEQSESPAIEDNVGSSMLLHSHFLKKAGDEVRAKLELQNALKLTQNRFRSCNGHAWMLALEGQLSDDDKDLALQLSETATNLSPNSGYVWNTRALALARAERWSESLEAIERAIDLGNGGTPSDWYIKSMALAGSGDLEAAQHWFSKADSLRSANGNNPSELTRLAKLAEQMMRHGK